MILGLLLTALMLLITYWIIRKAVFHGILDADRVRAEWAEEDERQRRAINRPLPDAPTS